MEPFAIFVVLQVLSIFSDSHYDTNSKSIPSLVSWNVIITFNNVTCFLACQLLYNTDLFFLSVLSWMMMIN